MNAKLYVGNLSYGTTDQVLQETFSKAGQVKSASVITDRDTRRSKGFGFVEMSSDEEAAKAVEMFNGIEMDGRKIVVSIARPKEDRPRTSGGGGFRGGSSRY